MVNGTGPILVAQYMLSANQVDPVNAGTAQSQGDWGFAAAFISLSEMATTRSAQSGPAGDATCDVPRILKFRNSTIKAKVIAK